jgi:hypothetical protein
LFGTASLQKCNRHDSPEVNEDAEANVENEVEEEKVGEIVEEKIENQNEGIEEEAPRPLCRNARIAEGIALPRSFIL